LDTRKPWRFLKKVKLSGREEAVEAPLWQGARRAAYSGYATDE